MATAIGGGRRLMDGNKGDDDEDGKEDAGNGNVDADDDGGHGSEGGGNADNYNGDGDGWGGDDNGNGDMLSQPIWFSRGVRSPKQAWARLPVSRVPGLVKVTVPAVALQTHRARIAAA